MLASRSLYLTLRAPLRFLGPAAVLLALGMAALALAGLAPRPDAAAESLPAGRVAEIVDGDTLILNDGREFRLVGIQAPKLPLGRVGFEAWPLAAEARTALAGLAAGRRVTPVATGAARDRHGRWLAHLERDDGLWLQGAMLEAGMARVYTFPDNRGRVPALLAAERTARAARRGIWGHPWYAIREAGDVARDIGSFQLVEGRVREAATVRGRTYLNFGADYRSDFTIAVEAGDRALFEEAGLDLEALEGRRVRVRGWVRAVNGPMIEATHPEQIEILD